MTNFQWKQVVCFVATLGNATIPDPIPDEIRDNLNTSVHLMLKHYPFIPQNLYKEINGVISPSRLAKQWYAVMRKSPGNVIIPREIYNSNHDLAEHIMRDNLTTDDRWEIIGSMASFMRDNREWTDYSDVQYEHLRNIGSLFVGMHSTTSYRKIMEEEEKTKVDSVLPEEE